MVNALLPALLQWRGMRYRIFYAEPDKGNCLYHLDMCMFRMAFAREQSDISNHAVQKQVAKCCRICIVADSEFARVFSSKKEKLHRDAAKLGGLLRVVGSHCCSDAFFCTVRIVLRVFYVTAFLFLCHAASSGNSKGFCRARASGGLVLPRDAASVGRGWGGAAR